MVNSQLNLPPEVLQSCDDILLSVKTPRLIHKLGAMTKELKEKGGTTLRSSRYDRLPTTVVPLAQEGNPVPSTPLVRVDKLYVHNKSSLIILKTEVVIN